MKNLNFKVTKGIPAGPKQTKFTDQLKKLKEQHSAPEVTPVLPKQAAPKKKTK